MSASLQGMMEVPRSIVREHVTKCTAHACNYHAWHEAVGLACPLRSSPLLTHIGSISELVAQILRHLDKPDLFKCLLVSRKWNNEANRILWMDSPLENLLSPSIDQDRLATYAPLIRHGQYTMRTGVDRMPLYSWGWSLTIRPLPPLLNLLSLRCRPNSLSQRTRAEMLAIFVPGLKEVVIDHEASMNPSHGPLQSPTLVWFDVMTENCTHLTLVSFGRNLSISTTLFERFLRRANNLKSVVLSEGYEHLLVNAVVPLLKRVQVEANLDDQGEQTLDWENLSSMHALEYLFITVVEGVWISANELLPLQQLTNLKRLTINRESYDPDTVRCSTSAHELALIVAAMPLLEQFIFLLDVEFSVTRQLRLGELLEDENEGVWFRSKKQRRVFLKGLQDVVDKEREAADDHIGAVDHGDAPEMPQ